MQANLLNQALDLLIFGMGTVFAFLALLVVAVNMMSRFMETYFPDAIVPEPHPTPSKSANDAVDSTTLAVIQAAIRQHRDKNARS